MSAPVHGDLIHDRFEVVAPSIRFAPIELRDRVTGHGARMAATGFFLEDASSFAMACWVKRQARVDLAEVLALRPTVLAHGSDEGTPSARELGQLTITLLERAFDLGADGITSAPHLAWIVRRGGTWDVVLPAGLGNGGELHFDQRIAAKRWPRHHTLIHACLGWLAGRLGTSPSPAGPAGRAWFTEPKTIPEALLALAREVNSPELAAHPWRERAVPWQRIDFGLAEELGEAALAHAPEGPRRAYCTRPLAALFHRRACLELQSGEPVAALAALERAITLDPCARHLTTKALVLESLGRETDAHAAHEAAASLLEDPQLFGEIVVIGDDTSVHDARTAHAYGAFLARRGDLDAALPWLERGLSVPDVLGPDPHRAMRLSTLAVVLYRLGKTRRLRALVDEALLLDPRDRSALALRGRLSA